VAQCHTVIPINSLLHSEFFIVLATQEQNEEMYFFYFSMLCKPV
jgi:hypothetical protein